MAKSRASSGDTVFVKPASNVYTILAAVATVVVLLGVIVVVLKAHSLWGSPDGSMTDGLLTAPPGQQTVGRR
jgi:hypothetical protein